MAFKERKRGGEIAASRFDELPAYMEMQVTTAGGLHQNWMFEVQWMNGPETAEEAEKMASVMQAGGPAAMTGATGPTGAAGGAGPAAAPGVTAGGGAAGVPPPKGGQPGVKGGATDKRVKGHGTPGAIN